MTEGNKTRTRRGGKKEEWEWGGGRGRWWSGGAGTRGDQAHARTRKRKPCSSDGKSSPALARNHREEAVTHQCTPPALGTTGRRSSLARGNEGNSVGGRERTRGPASGAQNGAGGLSLGGSLHGGPLMRQSAGYREPHKRPKEPPSSRYGKRLEEGGGGRSPRGRSERSTRQLEHLDGLDPGPTPLGGAVGGHGPWPLVQILTPPAIQAHPIARESNG